MKIAPARLSLFCLIFAMANLSSPLIAGKNAELCDGLAENALTREDMGSSQLDDPDIGSSAHLTACAEALRDKQIPVNSPRQLSLLRAKLLSSVMAGKDFSSDELLIDRAQFVLQFRGAAAKKLGSTDSIDPVIQKLWEKAPGAAKLTQRELDGFANSQRLIDLLLLNRNIRPNRADLDKALKTASDALAPFDIEGFRNLVAIASITPEITDAETAIYGSYARFFSPGYFDWAQALHIAGQDRAALNMINAWAPIQFSTEIIATSDDNAVVKKVDGPEAQEDYFSQLGRLKIAALAVDTIISSVATTPEERKPWVLRSFHYADTMQKLFADKAKLSAVPIWEQLDLSRAALSAVWPWRLVTAAKEIREKRWKDAQAELMASRSCTLLNETPCGSPGRVAIAKALLSETFPEKNTPLLQAIVDTGEVQATHRRHYTAIFKPEFGEPAIAKGIYAKLIGTPDKSANLENIVLDVTPGETSGGVANSLAISFVIDQKPLAEPELIRSMLRIAAAVAAKRGKSDLSFAFWSNGTVTGDQAMRKVFKLMPVKAGVSIAFFVALNVADQTKENQIALSSASIPVASITSLGSLSAGEQLIANQPD